MGLAFADTPTAEFVLIRPGSEALVVFRDQTEIAWLRWLKRGFRHCAVVVRIGGEWVMIDSLSHSICVGKFGDEPMSRLAWRYRQAGHIVIETVVGEGKARIAPPLPFTCVEAVKRVLGIQSWFVLTPHQLYRHLRAAKRLRRPEIGGETHPVAVEAA
ncbi:MAG: hypothetical protein J0H39_20640 [Alphaproteobacteria bacterium]|nr:hypothetical protein [Alphaproteobacteria bacterium]